MAEMDTATADSASLNMDIDVTQTNDGAVDRNEKADTDTPQSACESDGPVSLDTLYESSENEFKSPNEFALPLSLSAGKLKKASTAPQKHETLATSTLNDSSDQGQDSKHENKEAQKQQIPVSYMEPEWSGMAEEEYSFDVLKNGSIIDTVSLSGKPFHVFGRLPSCDVTLEHPSLSRYHAVVQYSAISTPSHDKGWYIYDLDSTHGTWVNKKKISPKVYHRLKVGHIVKFGGSSRLHILQGPELDEEEESEMTVTEMKEQREKLKKEAELLHQVELQEEMQRREAEQKILEDRGCSWGMGDDDAEENEEENPFASLEPENESLYIDDPKKALKGFYEREGCDLPDYQFTEVALGKHKCRLELPVDGPNGEDLVAEVTVSGKRKDAVVACALEACRMLDRLGLLRSSTHESRKRKQKKWEDDDFYDSDEDTFLDRTGTIEKKRFMRMKKAGKDAPETYESLLEKYNKVVEQIQEIESKLQKAKAEAEAFASEEMDDLDAYMMSIKSGAMDTKTRMQLKGDLLRLKAEEQKLRKLVNIAKPPSLPPLKPISTPTSVPSSAADSLSRKLHAQQKQQKKVTPVRTQAPVEMKPDDYEEQEEEDDKDEGKEETNHHQAPSPETQDKQQPQSMTSSDVKRSRDNSSAMKGPAAPPKAPEMPVKGPSLPPPHTHEESQGKKSFKSHHLSTSAVLSTLDSKKSTKQKGKSAIESNYDGTDPDYAMWLPPTEQSGDGRTSLNDKLGY